MIAVLAKKEEQGIVAEFFELFKTPWEFYRDDSAADVVICSRAGVPKTNAKLVLIYDGEINPFDRANEVQIRPQGSKKMLLYRGAPVPIYGNSLTFGAAAGQPLVDERLNEAALLEINLNRQTFVRIGYDLFQEIRHLLTTGQPVDHAQIPTLEIHIALLRDLIVGRSIPLVEIPPVPEGHSFIACLTHDADHVGIRNHKFDHTAFGFLYRATIGSAIDVLKRKKTLKQLAANWKAALSLPFVHMGLAKDFWHQFDHYVEIEKGLASTFFMIPEKGKSGRDADGHSPAKRAASYDAAELAENLKQLAVSGHEVGVHGIEAWRDAAAGREEWERISKLTGVSELGVRMHWLFFDGQSPAKLESAGFSYDSTFGYNETVGYRAGTGQVFKPFQTARMLELPMHVMDTALFFPSHLNLSPKQADDAVRPLIENAARFGGVLTVNWHDRSIAPERLWGDFYIRLLEQFKSGGAWITNAMRTVSWFRKRRSATFEWVASNGGGVKIKTSSVSDDGLPGLRVRIFRPNQTAAKFVELPFKNGMEICVAV
jgi:hypothetical protein